MIRRPHRYKHIDTPLPYTTHFRSRSRPPQTAPSRRRGAARQAGALVLGCHLLCIGRPSALRRAVLRVFSERAANWNRHRSLSAHSQRGAAGNAGARLPHQPPAGRLALGSASCRASVLPTASNLVGTVSLKHNTTTTHTPTPTPSHPQSQ